MTPTVTLTLVEHHDVVIDDDGDAHAHAEATDVLADEVHEVLLECGFTTEEIRHWADIYTRRAGSDDSDAFLDWISTYEHRW
jgi:hypothetical protein